MQKNHWRILQALHKNNRVTVKSTRDDEPVLILLQKTAGSGVESLTVYKLDLSSPHHKAGYGPLTVHQMFRKH